MEAHFIRLMMISGGMVAATMLLHAVFISLAGAALRAVTSRLFGLFRYMRDIGVLVAVGLWLMLAHALEIAIWAGVMWRLKLLPDFETALSYAALAYTTVSEGEHALAPHDQFFGAVAAADGFILFGMSAALLIDATLKLRLNSHRG